ncbi:tetratricopeptide repeat protein [Campylobacter helveticus]|uniref:beta-lactamase n=1 Tax=Campylobacter helveticus TaxID=28898 RepID=A0AAX2UIY5_9BACT|nr:tetratricopeptide repeat protein [Campylobacter helveticus]ARE80357.1 Sel1 domain repeat-containing protein [Campylobacter helveticus]MCR2055321.1 sel1 repeat family protein [Campylobacter helveticus]TNB57011.1 sel1 repeat family protein [Campylobacter helveticus]TNB57328.1 sel1 repeat family protein [Campylobacter helveticus]TNB60126.1 sel1 repeat family protein [Campylobacter helveticus]
MKKLILLIFLIFNGLLAQDIEKALKLYEGNKFAKAYELFESLCEKDSPRACFSLGYMNEKAQGVPRDMKKAYKFYDKSCKFGYAVACSNLALSLEENGYKDEAILAYNRACKLGNAKSCNNIALFYEEERDSELSLYFYKKSCELKDANACYKLGLFYEKGEWVRQNLNTALHFYSKSCTLGLGESCYILGRYNQLEKKDMKKAKRYFGMACDKKHKEACVAYREFNDRGIDIH